MATRHEAVVINSVFLPDAGKKVRKMDMLRLDLLHPVVSGNKYYKLKYNLQRAEKQGCKCILTFGGPYSNHLLATAYTAREAGFHSVGMVRGEWAKYKPTETLVDCENYGMELYYLSKAEYAERKQDGALGSVFPETYVIPEGGANEEGRAGIAEIADFVPQDYNYVCVSVGTGTTLVGLRNMLSCNQKVLGFAPFKSGEEFGREIFRHIESPKQLACEIFNYWHFGGFGRWNDALIGYMNRFYQINKTPLDVVYTAKMMVGIQELVEIGFFKADDSVLCLHTGGLQGNRSLVNRLVYCR